MAQYYFEFQGIMQSKQGNTMLRKFCEKDLTVESFDFIIECNELLAMPVSALAAKKERLMKIYNNYIKPSSVTQVNLASSMVTAIEKTLAQLESIGKQQSQQQPQQQDANTNNDIQIATNSSLVVTADASQPLEQQQQQPQVRSQAEMEDLICNTIYEQALRATTLPLKLNTFPRFIRSKEFLTAVAKMTPKDVEKNFNDT